MAQRRLAEIVAPRLARMSALGACSAQLFDKERLQASRLYCTIPPPEELILRFLGARMP
jgi:hypothetical protein